MPVSRPDNPYHFFLKLPPEIAAPDHYQLLGLPQFTDDQAAIKSAALERSRELRGWDNSNYHLRSNELLDEVVQAVMTLETPPRKVDYDRELRLKLGLLEAKPASATTTPEPRASSAPLSDRAAEDVSQRAANRREVAKQSGGAADRAKSVVTASEASTNEESGDQSTALRRVWGAAGGVTLLMLIGLYLGSCRPEQQTKPELPTISQQMEKPKNETPPDWDPAKFREVAILTGHTQAVLSVAFSPNGARLASASQDSTVKALGRGHGPGDRHANRTPGVCYECRLQPGRHADRLGEP